ncbi:acetyltransferase-like isoleucine patch superfamily enzyme [Dyella japonica]|uniref:Acetyltransferase-like isoleucine patch superfamily enzyme n=1 Tax=Dyella japonica TaxID=231455 RepID=A0ABV2JUP0_9GAMM
MIYPGTVITTNTAVGPYAQINAGCTVSHDVHLGEFSTLSPGVHVAGHVCIGRDVFVGTGANIINGRPDNLLSIGDGAIIAAGACVINSVEPGAMMAGVPATRKR